MLWPVDQPGISENLIRSLIQVFMSSNALLVLPLYEERRGHPAIFRRALFQEIMDTPLHEGLKGMVLRHQQDMVLLPTNELAAIEDIDTPEDYFRLTGERLAEALTKSAANCPDYTK
jgi:molybdenum cofactor cytidylyltransferase